MGSNMMERRTGIFWVMSCIVVLSILITARWTPVQAKAAVQYEGQWKLEPNGDVRVTRQYKLPLQYYKMWKDADMHLLEFRSFSPDRSALEVADMDYKWDDMKKTLTLSMKVLGLTRNYGDHWAAKILPGEEFSNLDGTKKIAYFHFSSEGPMGLIQGQDRIILPPQCSNPKWDASSRTINYSMPELLASGSGGWTTLWWVLFGVCLLGCAVSGYASFSMKPSSQVNT